MTFEEFLSLYRDAPVIDSSTFPIVSPNPAQLRFQVSYWQKRGWVHPLKRGVYVLDERYRQVAVSPLFVANYLLSPSYVSLEFALSHLGLVPEQARAYTSVTPKHRRRFDNVLGSFIYRSVKPSLMFGYEPTQDRGQECLIAKPEKALLDYFYLNSGALEVKPEQLQSLRLQNLDRLDLACLEEYARHYTRKVRRLAELVAHLAG